MPGTIRSQVRAVIAGGLVSLACGAAANAATPITVLTYNTDHGGKLNGTTGQLNTIAAQNPDVVVLEEASYTQLSEYVSGLNSRMNTTAWHGIYAQLCNTGTAPTCTVYDITTVMILTRLRTVSSSSKLIWAKDDYHVARPAVQMTVALADGTQVNVFGAHLPALSDAQTSRITFVNTLTTWAQSFAAPRLAGGDFNDLSGTSPITAMTQQYGDVWKAVGSGAGYTHSSTGTSLTSRIDYWFADLNGGATAVSAHTAGSLADSDHISLTATYNIPSKAVVVTLSETTLLDDSFSTLNKTTWPYGVYTGAQDSTIALAVNGAFQIGALKDGVTGTHYNGISSAKYDLSSDGSMSVQLVRAPNVATDAYAMFAAGSDGNNFYRWYESGNALVAEKKIAGTKTTLVNLPYDAAADQFLRIRREYNSATGTNDIVFETAPNNAGTPGTYTIRYREAWNSNVVATAMKCELKAGTSDAIVAPGTVTWDHVHVAKNSK